jgi:CelD/BcsL family acetyltransferase involved in cellulose biosynthesis
MILNQAAWKRDFAIDRKDSLRRGREELAAQAKPTTSGMRENKSGDPFDGRFAIEVARDLDSVEKDWARLEADGLLTPFQTRAWLAPFYRELAPRLKATPLIIVVRDRANGAPLMLLPLCARRIYGVNVVQFADLGVSDYNAPILAKNFDPTPAQWRRLWRRILAALGLRGILRFKNMPRLIAGRANPLTRYDRFSAPMDIASWGIELPATAAAYRTQFLSRKFAKDIAKKARRVARFGEVEFVLAQTPDERRLGFELLARQRQERCNEMGRGNSLSSPAYRRFYEAVAVESDAGLVKLFLLKVGGEALGAILALERGKALHVIMATFEGGDWRSCSLGNLLTLAAVENCIAEGIGFYDLTIGNEDYKKRFGAAPAQLHCALRPLTPADALLASALALAFAARKSLGRWIKRFKRGKSRHGSEADLDSRCDLPASAQRLREEVGNRP